MASNHRKWLRWAAILLVALVAVAVLVIAAFPVAPFRERAEATLSERFGRPVTIGALDRTPAFSFTPTIRIRDIRIPQPGWAGTGDLARIGTLDMRIRAFGLLRGRLDPKDVTASGVRLNLVRQADGRTNWDDPNSAESGTGHPLRLDGLTIRDAVVDYRDAKQDRRFTIAVTSDAKGFVARGQGNVRGAPVRVEASGPAITAAATPWPFRARIDGAQLSMTARGQMDAPLDTERMTIAVTAQADSLKRIDAVIEAGLFGTQPVRLTANVRHDGPKWQVDDLRGRIGRSDFAGRLGVDKTSGRTVLDGDIHATRLDFDDLADDAGLAKAAALTRAIGPRVVPNTRVDIGKIDKTDGRIAFRIDRILSRGSASPIGSAKGVLTLDRQLLTIDPLRVGLPRGVVAGTVKVDQRGGRADPTVTLALDLTGGSIAALAGGSDVTGRVDARVRLTGVGETIRAAVGRSSGAIGIVARDGALPAKVAAMLGFDAGRALTAGDDDRARLRCAVARLDMNGGRGRFAPLIVDTSASQTRGTGGIAFPAETIAATLTGAPKHGSLLRIPGSATASGTLSAPKVVVPPETKSVGNILKGLGRAITGRQGPTASDADCAALSRQAIGR
ncbi:AsmA family protein [Sphingomonas floccifaciens]|uniref:AsmA family protein n=1 Tax=Sphingomonas floccifaciens TaxID=1844115 RepID=A0ABW4NCW2_9SPHN